MLLMLLCSPYIYDVLFLLPLIQKAHDSMVSAMVCSKEYLYTSSLGCIKASAKHVIVL